MVDKKDITCVLKDKDIDFYMQVSNVLAEARQFAKRQLDNVIVSTYYEIGRMIVVFLASKKSCNAELNYPSTPIPLLGIHGRVHKAVALTLENQ